MKETKPTMKTLIFAILLPVLTIGTVGTYANAGVQSHMMEQVAAGGLLGDYSLVLNFTN
jgi:hypothetical protein